MSELRLQVNGKSVSLHHGATVADLVTSLKLSPTGVAIAVNQTVIPSSELQHIQLKAADQIEIIQAVGGG